MTLSDVTGLFELIAPRASRLDAVLKFDFGDEGVVVLDAKGDPVTVSNEDREADTTVTVSLADFAKILNKELPGDLAFAMGKLRLSGDMITGMSVTNLLNR
ncbi:MAG: SCP2 sterol-binding domain-containing protein [Pseudomonadota bacterium]